MIKNYLISQFRMQEADAEDISSNAIIKAFLAMDGCKEEIKKAGPWIIKISRNEAVEFLRNQKRRKAYEKGFFEILRYTADKREKRQREELAEEIFDAIKEKSMLNYRIFKMKFMDGLKTDEIARVLNINEEVVYKRIKREIERLRKRMNIYVERAEKC